MRDELDHYSAGPGKQMNIVARRCLLLLFCVLGSRAESSESGALGRLFLTPQQRAAFDRQRLGDSPIESGDDEESLTLDGEIRRQSSRRMYWINGKHSERNNLPSLDVGDTYHSRSGERENLLGQGRIIIKPDKATK